jgi:hypothetical protein
VLTILLLNSIPATTKGVTPAVDQHESTPELLTLKFANREKRALSIETLGYSITLKGTHFLLPEFTHTEKKEATIPVSVETLGYAITLRNSPNGIIDIC